MPSFTYGDPYGTAFYEGGGASTLVPYIGEVALGGHMYLLDHLGEPAGVEFVSVPLQKQQYDTSTSPGEQSINPEAFWRRLRESFHLGAGQTDADREESSPFRYRLSTHLDPWTRWKICLLPETLPKGISAATNQRLMVVGDRLYYLNGTALGYYTDIVAGSITPITGLPGTQASSIASDGFNVITAHGASGIYKNTRSINTSASHITGTVTGLGFVRGRFLASNGAAIYDVTSLTVGGGGALPAAIFTQGNTDFSWVGFAEGSGWIYAAGFSGDKSLIYKTQVREDGTALAAFSVAAELPEGEVVASIKGYLGRFICIGTNKGFRLAVVTGSGDLSVGVNVPTTSPVLDFEGQDKFIWFGYGNYQSTPETLTGLGRMSVEDFVNLDLLQPAWASDLMVHGQTANITSIVTFQNRRVFTLHQIGLYYEGTNLEADGWLDSGLVSYGTNEPKVGLFFNLQHREEFGSIEVQAAADGGSLVSIGEREGVVQPMPKLAVGELSASAFEFRIILKRDDSVLTAGPCLMSWLFRAQPKSEVTTMIMAKLRLAPVQDNLTDTYSYFDVLAEQDFIKQLHQEKTVTTWTMLDRVHTVIVEDFQGSFLRLIANEDGLGFSANERVVIKMKEII